MKIVTSVLCFLICSCATKHAPQSKPIWARLTTYNAHEDKYGSRVAASPSIRNKQGFGVAAHPDFPFYTKVKIPCLNGVLDKDADFTIIDRGSAVTKKTASRNTCYVFDIFLETKTHVPDYGWIYIQ